MANLAKEFIAIQHNILDAKNNLSKICQTLVDKKEDFILIANNGKPVAKIVPYETARKKPGYYKNKYKSLSNVDWFNDDATNLFYGEDK